MPGPGWQLCVHVHRRQIHPLFVTIGHIRQANPVQHARIVAADLEFGNRRRAVHEMNSAALAVALDVESAHPMTRNSIEIVFAAGKGEADQLDHLLPATCEVLAEAEKPQAMLAKRAKCDPQRPAVGPARQIAFKTTAFVLTVARRITPKKDSQNS